jgi:phosphatidylglycerol lysyltransferase
LWWQFTLDGDAPRFLRATVGGAVVVLIVGLAALLKLAPRSPAGAPISSGPRR